jgi:hypothetical protein
MILIVTLVLITVIAVALMYGSQRWKSLTAEIHSVLNAKRLPFAATTYSTGELSHLPAPVQKYFRAVLTDGQALVSGVFIEHTGTFNMSEAGENWKPFTSTQRIAARRPGFDWEARIAMMPGLAARVHDAYVGGEGRLHASLLGLVSLATLRGTPDIAQGELLRFLAETAWYPTALLPSQGVRWKAVSDLSAEATLKDGENEVTLLFRFGDNGLIQSIRAEARGRTVAGAVIPTPWEGRWSQYELHDRMLIPTEGEVAWMLPDGRKPYWRGRITSIRYEFAR